MKYIIETEKQLNDIHWDNKVFLHIIPYNYNVHPAINKLSLLYIAYKNERFVISHQHTESFSLNIINILQRIQTIPEVYVINKKNFLHYFNIENHNNIFDILLIEDVDIPNMDLSYWGNYINIDNLNTIVPISKHIEYCDSLFDKIKHLLEKYPNELYNNIATQVFKDIEVEGIKIDKELFDSYFNTHCDSNSIQNNIIYSNYNFYTTTRRPSNSFNNINFNSLNKSNGCKNSFIPKNNIFVEIDISSYHPSIIANLVNYDFGDENIHSHLANLYNLPYDKAKELTFKQIYGNIFDKYKDLEYFKKIQKFIDDSWEIYKINNFYKTYSGVDLKGVNMNSNKLFNYIIQELETSLNLFFISKIQQLLKHKKSKLVLYTFDAFTIDLCEDEHDIIEIIIDLFKSRNLQVKSKYKKTLN